MLFLISNTMYVIVLSSISYSLKPHPFLIAIPIICSFILLYLFYEIYLRVYLKNQYQSRKSQKFLIKIFFYVLLTLFQTEINCFLFREILITNSIQIFIQTMKIITYYAPKFHSLNLKFEEIQTLTQFSHRKEYTNKSMIIFITALFTVLIVYQCLRTYIMANQFPNLLLLSMIYYISIIIYEFYHFLIYQIKTKQKYLQLEQKKSSLAQIPQNIDHHLDLQIFSSEDKKPEEKIFDVNPNILFNFMSEGIVIFEKKNDQLSLIFNNFIVLKLLGVNDQFEIVEKLKEQKQWEIMTIDDRKSLQQMRLSQSISSHQSFGFIWNSLHQTRECSKQIGLKKSIGSMKFINDKAKQAASQKSQFFDKKMTSQYQIKISENNSEMPHKMSISQNIEASSQQGKPDLFTFLNQEWKNKRFLDPNQMNDKFEYSILSFELSNQENQYIMIELCIFPIMFEKKAQMLVLLRDITHRKYINKLKDHNKQKSKTISFVSHEFRTPLNCIITMLEQFEEEAPEDYNHNYIKSAINNAKYLLNLSNDLLDLAQLKAGKFSLNCSRFNFSKLIEECFQMFKLQSVKKGISLNLNYLSKTPVKIYSDKNRIRQIIINLLSNAFKFTTEGSITVTVSLDKTHTQDLLVEVEDTGLGIKKDDQKMLFMAFGKSNSEESKKINNQGVGLGLVISNIIAQQLSSSPVSGLRFTSEFRQG